MQLLADIADHLDAHGFDGKKKSMGDEYRDLLLELATIIGPMPVLLGTQRGAPICGDYELVRCLLNQLQEHQDELIVEQIPAAMMNSQFHIGMLLVWFYLHKLPAGRKPERKLTAMELYRAFEALDEVLPFQSQGDEGRAALDLMRLLSETGYIHNILYRAQAGRFAPCQSFYEKMCLLKPHELHNLSLFHTGRHGQ